MVLLLEINSAHSNSKTELALLRAWPCKELFFKSLCKKKFVVVKGTLFIAIVKKDNECKKAMKSCNNLFRNLAYYLD